MIFYSWAAKEGNARCCARFELCCWLHRAPWAARTCATAFRRLCVCSQGGMAGCLPGPWWSDVHVLLRAANDWVLVGGSSMFRLRNVACLPWVSLERHLSCLGQECVESGPRVGQELKIVRVSFQSWSMRAPSGGAGAGQDMAMSVSIVDHACAQSGPIIDRCCSIDAPNGVFGVGNWLVNSGLQAVHERVPPTIGLQVGHKRVTSESHPWVTSG